MFELGARPHPPRDLYRAYLEQSHIFIGIYWQHYGWVAPGETISGLEDEYQLSGSRPKLIYIKAPAPERESGLTELLDRVRNDDTASYKPFSTTTELRELIENDLAILLMERFETAQVTGAQLAVVVAEPRRNNLPGSSLRSLDARGKSPPYATCLCATMCAWSRSLASAGRARPVWLCRLQPISATCSKMASFWFYWRRSATRIW